MIINERLKRLESLFETIRVFNTDLDDSIMLQSIIASACELTQSEVASVLQYKESDGYLHFLAAPWFHRDPIQYMRVPIGNSIAGWVFKQKKSLIVQDVNKDKRFYPEVDAAINFQTKSLMAVPLFFNGNPVGVIEAINKVNQAYYNEEDLTILETLASLAALVIKNSLLKSQIRKFEEETERLEQMKKDFIAISSHELRTPLGIILGHATFLREVIDETHYEQIVTIIDSSTKLKEIIENMACIDNYQNDAARLRRRKIPIVNLVKDAVKKHAEMAEEKKIVIHIDALENNLLIEGDAKKIEIIINNLLKNALIFTPEGGHVFVVMTQVPGYVKISVIDDGIGIHPEDLEKVFDRFYQVQDHLTRQHGGMGLGLSVAKIMVEMHGGEIWAESIPETGSRFTFTLPINLRQVDAAEKLFKSK